MLVCMSRRICVDLYRKLVTALRPRLVQRRRQPGHDQGCDDRLGIGPAGVAATHPQQAQAGGPRAREFRDPDDPFQVVIVRDMWLTGFDAPSLHTMYVDKPMRDHGLMQAITQGQPGVQEQARRTHRGLHGPRQRAEEGREYVHGERRCRSAHAGPG